MAYESYRGLPPLAGLCSMERALEANWSVERSVEELKLLHYFLKRLYEVFTSRITGEPIYELKTAFSHHAYLCSEQVSLIRKRVGEMREPPLGLEKIPHPAAELVMDEIQSAPTTEELLVGLYQTILPMIHVRCKELQRAAHPLADAPTVRTAKLISFELDELIQFGQQAVACVVQPASHDAMAAWTDLLRACLDALSNRDAALPERRYSQSPYHFQREPKRDGRFQDSFNAGVNPEAFLYGTEYLPRDKVLMMYYKRLRELDVPEMMASILQELKEEPWEFHAEMSRQLWDEARHAMMGEVGFVSCGIDWTKIPINFTWSLNLNTQLNARERHGVLFFIEQGLMPRTGKRYEWEVACESGAPLAAMFQDYDWADEVLHAQIGRRWYVPRFKNLNEALEYGDRCWSKVLSHWQRYAEEGLTEHRNWWPEIYREACERWQVEPDPKALAFCETYARQRADLKNL